MVEGATVEAAASGGLWAALPGGGFGWLGSAHLGDYAPLEEAWEGAYPAGAALPQLLVLRVQPPSAKLGAGRVHLTAKTALLAAAAAGALPADPTALKPGSLLCGHVSRLAAEGAYISFLGDCGGFCPTARLSDDFVARPSAILRQGQTVLACVLEPGSATKPGSASLTLRPSRCAAAATSGSAIPPPSLAAAFVRERLALAAARAAAGGEAADGADEATAAAAAAAAHERGSSPLL